jgi:hypothetical protein
VEWIWGFVLMAINIKTELQNLDRNDFISVANLVDRIIKDIWDTATDDDCLDGLMKDYMIDLINPDLLDFDSSES